MKRPEILRDFVALVEDEFDDVNDADIVMLLYNFIGTGVKITL